MNTNHNNSSSTINNNRRSVKNTHGSNRNNNNNHDSLRWNISTLTISPSQRTKKTTIFAFHPDFRRQRGRPRKDRRLRRAKSRTTLIGRRDGRIPIGRRGTICSIYHLPEITEDR